MILGLILGQSDIRGNPNAHDGHHNFGANTKVWNNGESATGNKFIDPTWGKYPLDKVGPDGQRVNSLIQGFSTVVAQRGESLSAIQIAKSGHPIECFLSRDVRDGNGWVIPDGRANLAPFLYCDGDGIDSPLIYTGKSHYDFVLILHGQGNNGNSATEYSAKQISLFEDLTNRGAIGNDTIILMGGFFDGHSYYATHKQASLITQGVVANSVYVDSAGLIDTGDGIHLRGAALINMGARLANNYFWMLP